MINVELTAGGGGKSDSRLTKLKERNKGLYDQRVSKTDYPFFRLGFDSTPFISRSACRKTQKMVNRSLLLNDHSATQQRLASTRFNRRRGHGQSETLKMMGKRIGVDKNTAEFGSHEPESGELA